ncbi:hypothetical protein Vadar_027657 [Vaccinium darrowii]|uniref:Uncharacterized protein n=1 Tax=Vaccinium darrowii TaxID=229202 RepID=A0ACB7Y2K2_9ERIC|nr:hypothetical protein Vadar_027657 [Vaccinium darrowii]
MIMENAMLCCVGLRREEIEDGSEQLYPCTGNFDTGVDDLGNSKWYIEWSTDMNSHILPECVVSFKYTNCLAGVLSASRDMCLEFESHQGIEGPSSRPFQELLNSFLQE